MHSTIICFSKDRPWQLKQMINSLYSHIKSSTFELHVIVKMNCENLDITRCYASLMASLASNDSIMFYEEVDFATQLSAIISTTTSSYILFCVDDILFHSDIDLASAGKILADNHNIFAVHPKLHPGITFSHTANHALQLPSRFYIPAIGSSDWLLYELADCNGDWRYPWDMCASMYRVGDVRDMLVAIEEHFGIEGLSHPNLLEANGDAVIRKKLHPRQNSLSSKSLYCASASACKLCVITVNRVQSVFANPIYKASCSLLHVDDEEVGTVASLVKYFDDGVVLDEDYYKNFNFSSVHVGALRVLSRSPIVEARCGDVMCRPKLSVIMPAFNSESYICEAIESIRSQTFSDFEFIIIDDGSEDGTWELLLAAAKIDDRIRLLRNEENRGIAASLNSAIKVAKGEYIARMDADDISATTRLQVQVDFLNHNKDVMILGSGVEIFHDDSPPSLDSSAIDSQKANYIFNPSNAVMCSWSMYFFCSVAHPSIMLRSSWIEDLEVVYDTCALHVEDYALWLRAVEDNVTITNIPQVLLHLRKHKRAISSIHSDFQRDSAASIVAASLSRLLDWDVKVNTVKKMWSPSTLETVVELGEVYQLVENMESFFVSKRLRSSAIEDSGMDEVGLKLFRADVNNRLGEIAVSGMGSFALDAMEVFAKWSSRDKSVHYKMRSILGS